MKKLWQYLKSEPMLIAAAAAALISLLITPPDAALVKGIDWKTLATLFMLLSVLDGFKTEDLFLPVLRLTDRIHSLLGLSFFLVYGVFFSSMLVTNDVSLIIFVPLTILLFQARQAEKYILPILVMENTAAVRGSLLTPFGSPQNLFLYANSGVSFGEFTAMMLPLCLGSLVLIAVFLVFIHRGEKGSRQASVQHSAKQWDPARKLPRVMYLTLFLCVVICIVSRTAWWPAVTLGVTVVLLIFDRKVFTRVDYALLGTFLCFFVFSSSLARNEKIAGFLAEAVAGREYLWSIGISQVISNVPAAIVLWPFTTDLRALLYGLDTAGLVTIIGSLASVINLRLYTRSYPGQGGKFMVAFEKYSLAFFVPAFLLQWLLLR